MENARRRKVTDDRSATRCYACLASAPAQARSCPRCHAPLDLTPARRSVGVAYLLNTLPGLVESGTIDGATASRIAEAVLTPAAAPPVRRAELAATAAQPTPARVEARAEDVLGSQAPSLLLYVGAFLIVVSALIFVSVSGDQISDPLKLALMLLGTGGFLGAGMVLHRYPRVAQAGRTFLVIGSLLIPIDVAATYALFLRETPFTAPLLWLWGSVIGAVLYAKLAVDGYGPWYSRFFFLATVSALAALLFTVDAPGAWWGPAFVALSATHVLVRSLVRAGSAMRLTLPLLRPSQILAPVPLVLTLVAAAFGAFGDTADRAAVLMTVLLATVNYALLGREAAARIAAATCAGLVTLAVLYVARAPTGAYGLTLLALAAAYVLAASAVTHERAGPYVPPAAASELRVVGYLWAALALSLVLHYETAALTGAVVHLGAAALFAAMAFSSRARPVVSGEAVAPLDRLRLDEPLVYVAAATLHLGTRYLLRALSLDPEGLGGLVRGSPAVEWATAGFVASLVLAGATALAIRLRPHLRDALGASALASMVWVVAAAAPIDGHRAVFSTAFAGLLFATTVAAAKPALLWSAAAFAAVAALAVFERAAVPDEIRPTALVLAGLVLYAAGLSLRARSALASTAREIGIATAGLGALVAYAIVADLATASLARAIGTPLWRSATLALLAVALLLGAESRVRGVFWLAAAASATALGAILTEVARRGPNDIQAYAVPTGVYLIGLALFALRYGPASWQQRVTGIEAAGALVLVTPTYERMWGHDGFTHGLALLIEVAALLAVGIVLRRRWLVAIALGALGLATLRVLVNAFDRLPNWVVFATSGTVLLAIGFVLLLKRELWVSWQERAISWWRRWQTTDRA